MRIVDNRNMENELIEFKELPAWCVFEVPDYNDNGFYIKLTQAELGDAYSKDLYDMNSLRLDDPMIGYCYTLPDTIVRPLDVEIHINGVKKF